MELFLASVWAILAVILIDIVLAGDNALIIGMVANRLPPHLRRKAIIWGTVGAIGIRFLSVAVLTWLLTIPGLRLVGGLALFYIAWKLVFADDEQQHDHTADTFWGAMGTIMMADAVMGIDNALGIAAAAGGNWWVIIFGLLISVPIILFGSTMVNRVLERWPRAIYIGSAVLAVVGAQMIYKEPLLRVWLSS
jgi:YjbE family integral membrane protein